MDNIDVPSTLAEWAALDPADVAGLRTAMTDVLLVDVHDSLVFSVCAAALSIRTVGARACAPLHEIESLYAGALRASHELLDYAIGEFAITPAKLSLVEAWLRAPGGDAFSMEACSPTTFVRRLRRFVEAHTLPASLVVNRDDLFPLERTAAAARANVSWPSKMTFESLVSPDGTLLSFGSVAAFFGPRLREAPRADASGRMRMLADALKVCAAPSSFGDVAAGLAGNLVGTLVVQSEWPVHLVTRVRSQAEAIADVHSRAAMVSGDVPLVARAMMQRFDAVVDCYPHV